MTRNEALQVLRLCDKLDWGQLLDLGSYLIACAFHQRKPTQGTR
jgi:hypothetical protein